ncbi:hypothetical protein TX24_14385, partial [Pseudomonas lactis]
VVRRQQLAQHGFFSLMGITGHIGVLYRLSGENWRVTTILPEGAVEELNVGKARVTNSGLVVNVERPSLFPRISPGGFPFRQPFAPVFNPEVARFDLDQ